MTEKQWKFWEDRNLIALTRIYGPKSVGKRLEKMQKEVRRNEAKINGCAIHEFDWRGALKAERDRRLTRQQETGVIVNVRMPCVCRCKNCGGKMPVEYAAAYMDGVNAALGKKEKRQPKGGAKNGD